MTEHEHKIDANVRGVGFLVLGMLIFSLQDIAVKWIGGNYPVLEIVAFRSVVALPLTLLLFRFEGSADCQPQNGTNLNTSVVCVTFSPIPRTLWDWQRCPWPKSLR